VEKTKEIKGFMMACKEFFGYRDRQTLSGFAEEMGEVSMPFRKEIYQYLKSTGVECRAPDAFHTGRVQ